MFKIKWSPEAEHQYFETLKYRIDHNKSNAYLLKIIDEVPFLSLTPYIGSVIEGVKAKTQRVLVFTVFILMYCYCFVLEQ